MRAPRDIAQGIAQLEGYLLSQHELTTARAEAEAFARRVPWLTGAQHDDLVRLYTADRIALSRSVLRATVDRCEELRGEYTARYETLRRRLLCGYGVLMLGSTMGLVWALPAIGAR